MFEVGDRVTGETPLGRTVTGTVKIVEPAALWVEEDGGDPLAWAPVHRSTAVEVL